MHVVEHFIQGAILLELGACPRLAIVTRMSWFEPDVSIIGGE